MPTTTAAATAKRRKKGTRVNGFRAPRDTPLAQNECIFIYISMQPGIVIAMDFALNEME